MVFADLSIISLHCLQVQLLGLFPLAMLPICHCHKPYTEQRFPMVLVKFGLVILHELHMELLDLLPPVLGTVEVRVLV